MTITLKQLLVGLLVLGVVIAAVVKTWLGHAWGDHMKEIFFGFAGVVAFFFPDEFASFQGYRAWRMNQWRFHPSWWFKFTGFVLVMLCGASILFEK